MREHILAVCKAHKVKDEVANLIADAVMAVIPTSRQRSSNVKEENGVTLYRCRYLDEWFTEDQMVFSKGKSKGYSKIGISLWNKQNALIKKLESSIASDIVKGVVNVDELVAQLQEAKANLNSVDFYRSQL